MALKVRFTRRAQSDIAKIRVHILQHDQAAAERVRRAVVASIVRLSEHGLIGRQSELPGVRIKLVPRYPFKIYYRATPDSVQILHVRHTARREPDPGEVI